MNKRLPSSMEHAWRSPKSTKDQQSDPHLWSQGRRESIRRLLLGMIRCSSQRAQTTWTGLTSSWEHRSRGQSILKKSMWRTWWEQSTIGRESWDSLSRTSQTSLSRSRVRRMCMRRRRGTMSSSSLSRIFSEISSLTCTNLPENKEWTWRRLSRSSIHHREEKPLDNISQWPVRTVQLSS